MNCKFCGSQIDIRRGGYTYTVKDGERVYFCSDNHKDEWLQKEEEEEETSFW